MPRIPSLACFLARSMCTLSLLTALAPAAAAPRIDHYDPAALNERALQRYEQGDRGTALILLERAHLLAPHDRRIARNLEVLRALQRGQPLPPPGALAELPGDAAAPASTASDADTAPLLPAPLWPKPN